MSIDTARTHRPRWPSSSLVALALVAALALDGCASLGKESRAARRAEESAESAAVEPVAPMPLPAPAPVPVRRVAKEWPALSLPGNAARPVSALVRSTGASGSAPDDRQVARAIEIPFAAGGIELASNARALLDAFAARLNLADAEYYLEIQGHADASGTLSANMAIGLRRAEVVRRYLLAATRIPSERIAVVSLGAGQPVADNSTAEGRALNRRVIVLALR